VRAFLEMRSRFCLKTFFFLSFLHFLAKQLYQAEAVVQWQTINRVCGDLAVSR